MARDPTYLLIIIFFIVICRSSAVGYWSLWTPCTKGKDCKKGTRFRHFVCINPNDPKCKEPMFEAKRCNDADCGLSKLLSIKNFQDLSTKWTAWETCSNSCGNGISVRLRSCGKGKKTCAGNVLEMRTCVGQDKDCINYLINDRKRKTMDGKNSSYWKVELMFLLTFILTSALLIAGGSIVYMYNMSRQTMSDNVKP